MAQIKRKWLEASIIDVTKLANDAVETAKIKDAHVTGPKLAANAKQAVLESKLRACRDAVLAKSVNGSSANVTTEVVAAAVNDTPRTSLSAGKGIYTGAITGVSDAKKVLIRAAGTDNGIDDGTGDDVYGVMSEASVKASKIIQDLTYTADTGGVAGNGITLTYVNPGAPNQSLSIGVVDTDITVNLATDGDSNLTSTATQIKTAIDNDAGAAALVDVVVSGTGGNVQAAQVETALEGGVDDDFTLSFKKSNGDAYSFSGPTSIDFFFVEIYDLYDMPIDAALGDALGGVIDATAADALAAHKVQATGAHADTAISSVFSGTTYLDAQTTVHGALVALDSAAAAAASAASAAQSTANSAQTHIGHLVTLSGVSTDADHLGEFSGTTIADNSTVKAAIQALETRLEAVALAAGATKTEKLTLTSDDITNKYKDLVSSVAVRTPADTSILTPVGGPRQVYNTDYTIITNGSIVKRVNWNGLGLEALLAEGDELLVTFEVAS